MSCQSIREAKAQKSWDLRNHKGWQWVSQFCSKWEPGRARSAARLTLGKTKRERGSQCLFCSHLPHGDKWSSKWKGRNEHSGKKSGVRDRGGDYGDLICLAAFKDKENLVPMADVSVWTSEKCEASKRKKDMSGLWEGWRANPEAEQHSGEKQDAIAHSHRFQLSSVAHLGCDLGNFSNLGASVSSTINMG